jgi:hypothetical protein
MSKMIAYCGLVCTNCPTFLATKNDDDVARKKTADMYAELYGFNLKPEEINCDGCLTIGGRKNTYCQDCEIRPCCSKKGLKNCIHCAEHQECEKINNLHELSFKARACFESLRNEIGYI